MSEQGNSGKNLYLPFYLFVLFFLFFRGFQNAVAYQAMIFLEKIFFLIVIQTDRRRENGADEKRYDKCVTSGIPEKREKEGKLLKQAEIIKVKRVKNKPRLYDN